MGYYRKNCSDEHRSVVQDTLWSTLEILRILRHPEEKPTDISLKMFLARPTSLNILASRLRMAVSPKSTWPSPLHMLSTSRLRFKSGTSSRRWVARQKDDVHSKMSKSEGFRSRAAYKLIEIDNKYKLFGKSCKNMVDLGFAPGAWTQVALARSKSRNVRPNILGVDLLHCSPPEGASFLQGDIFSKKTHSEIVDYFSGEMAQDATISYEIERPLDLVLSDMMVNTSGIKDNDHFASMDLCDGVLILACRLLKKNGNLVMKFYTGKEEQILQKKLERVFTRVQMIKPEACRAELREMYFVGLRKRLDDISIDEVFEL